MIDTHAHLDALDHPDAAVARAAEAGVGRILTVGTTVVSGVPANMRRSRGSIASASGKSDCFISVAMVHLLSSCSP